MKAVVAAFNQEKALVGAFSVIVQLHQLIDLRHYFKPSQEEYHVVRLLLKTSELCFVLIVTQDIGDLTRCHRNPVSPSPPPLRSSEDFTSALVKYWLCHNISRAVVMSV